MKKKPEAKTLLACTIFYGENYHIAMNTKKRTESRSNSYLIELDTRMYTLSYCNSTRIKFQDSAGSPYISVPPQYFLGYMQYTSNY